MACFLGEADGTTAGTWTPTAGLRMCWGKGELPARVLEGNPPLTVAGVLAAADVPPLAWSARVGAECEAKTINAPPRAAATDSTATAATVTAPWLRRPPSHFVSPATRWNHLCGGGSECRVPESRVTSAQRRSTCSRNASGGTGNGNKSNNASGRSAPRL